MKLSATYVSAMLCAIAVTSLIGHAQPAPATMPTTNAANSTIVSRMMQFDKNADGKLSREEINDNRFMALFEQADANHDGTVTRDELIAVAMVLDTPVDAPRAGRAGRAGRGPAPEGAAGAAPDGRGMPPGGRAGGAPEGRGGPPDGRGGPDGRGPGGRGPGQVVPPPLRDMLNLTPEQNQQLDALQRDVDERLSRILTPEQRTLLQDAAARGRGGPGGRGPRGGPDGRGPGGPPPP